MKQKLIIALLINVAVLVYFTKNFLNNGDINKIAPWRFYSSLFAVIVFGIFVFLIIRQLVQLKENS